MQTSNPRRSYCDFSVLPYGLKHCVTFCTRLWDNFHPVWPSTTYPCLNYSIFLMLIRYVTLRPWPMTRWPWKFVVHQASRDQSLHEIWAKSSNSRLNYWWFCEFLHTLSRCDLDLWPLDHEPLQHFACHVFKLCTKFERNRIIRGWVIDNLVRFRSAILWVGHDWQTVLRGAWTQFTKLRRKHWAIILLHKMFVSAFGYLAAFSNAGSSKLSDVENDAKFRTFEPLWKLVDHYEFPVTIFEV